MSPVCNSAVKSIIIGGSDQIVSQYTCPQKILKERFPSLRGQLSRTQLMCVPKNPNWILLESINFQILTEIFNAQQNTKLFVID